MLDTSSMLAAQAVVKASAQGSRQAQRTRSEMAWLMTSYQQPMKELGTDVNALQQRDQSNDRQSGRALLNTNAETDAIRAVVLAALNHSGEKAAVVRPSQVTLSSNSNKTSFLSRNFEDNQKHSSKTSGNIHNKSMLADNLNKKKGQHQQPAFRWPSHHLNTDGDDINNKTMNNFSFLPNKLMAKNQKRDGASMTMRGTNQSFFDRQPQMDDTMGRGLAQSFVATRNQDYLITQQLAQLQKIVSNNRHKRADV